MSCGLPWFAGTVAGPGRLDPIGVLAAILVSLLVWLLRWPAFARLTGHASGVAREDGPMPHPVLPLGGTLTTAGACVAVLADRPILAWTGLVLATAASVAAVSPRQTRLAGLGLGLVLFGNVTASAAARPAGVTLLVGLACLAAISPELAGLAALLLLRMRVTLGAVPGLDPLLIAAGLLALAIAITGLARPRPNRLATLATLGQGGVAVFALGLHAPDASFAAVLQLVLLVLTRLALELAPSEGLPRLVALAGMAGLPPFGLFPSLALLLAATAAHAIWLMLPLLAGLAALGWLVLRARTGRTLPAAADAGLAAPGRGAGAGPGDAWPGRRRPASGGGAAAMMLRDALLAAPAEPCRPTPRRVLSPELWAALPQDPALRLLALWADTIQVHALLLDRVDGAGAAGLASRCRSGAYPALSPRLAGRRLVRADGARPVGPRRGAVARTCVRGWTTATGRTPCRWRRAPGRPPRPRNRRISSPTNPTA